MAQALDTFEQDGGWPGKAPSQPAFAFRAKGRTGRQPEAGGLHQVLGQCNAVTGAVDAEERIHRSIRNPRGDARDGAQLGQKCFPAKGQATPECRQIRLARFNSNDASFLNEGGRAGGIEFDEFPKISDQGDGQDQPSSTAATRTLRGQRT